MVEQLIERLKNPDTKARAAAHDELKKLGRSGTLTLADAETLIRAAATHTFPKPEHDWQDSAEPLLWAARDITSDKDPAKLLPVIASTFAKLTPGAKATAIHMITLTTTDAAVDLYLQCLEQHGHDLKDKPVFEYAPTAGQQVASRLFPRLLNLTKHHCLTFMAMHTLLEFRQANLIPATIAAAHDDTLTQLTRAEVEGARRHQKPEGLGWREDDPYSPHREP